MAQVITDNSKYIEGRGGIEAEILADSICRGSRITTFRLRYPRFIHAELMTHRVFSRNASSSRAIPFNRIKDEIRDNPAKPIHWGSNRRGMVAEQEVSEEDKISADELWNLLAGYSVQFADTLYNQFGLHKQVVNRLIEPFKFIDVIVTSTEWNNFYNLRTAHDAQPEIQELAKSMLYIHQKSRPMELGHMDWHIPFDPEGNLDLETRLKVSAARCARISYTNHDGIYDIHNDLELVQRLKDSEHMTPFEHQATPISPKLPLLWRLDKDVTHMDQEGNLWCKNLRGWASVRHSIERRDSFIYD